MTLTDQDDAGKADRQSRGVTWELALSLVALAVGGGAVVRSVAAGNWSRAAVFGLLFAGTALFLLSRTSVGRALGGRLRRLGGYAGEGAFMAFIWGSVAVTTWRAAGTREPFWVVAAAINACAGAWWTYEYVKAVRRRQSASDGPTKETTRQA